MKVVLELQDQPSNIRKVTVRHDIVIGRGAECNLRLSAPQVSRRHCFLRIGTEGAFLSDLDSSNGTYLNGKKLTSGKRYSLEDGSVLSVGPVKFVARVQSEVPSNQMLQVQVADARIEAEASAAASSPSPEVNVIATVAGLPGDPEPGAMNFAIEHAGSSAAEDDATADYVSTDGIAESDYFSDDEPEEFVASARPAGAAKEPETVASVEIEDDLVLELADEDEVTLLEDDLVGDDDSELDNFLKDLG